MLRDEDPSGTGIRGDRAPETLGAGDPEERAGRAGAASPADLSCPSRRPVGPGHVAHLAQVRRGRTPFPGSQVTPGRSGVGGRSRDAAVAGPRPQAQPGLSAPLPACCRCLLGVFPGGAARPGPGGSSRPRPAGRDGPCPPPSSPPLYTGDRHGLVPVPPETGVPRVPPPRQDRLLLRVPRASPETGALRPCVPAPHPGLGDRPPPCHQLSPCCRCSPPSVPSLCSGTFPAVALGGWCR